MVSVTQFISTPRCVGNVSALFALVIFVVGCNTVPPPVKPPEWKPQEQAKKGIELYDKDGDGKINSAEMSPGLKAALANIDTDGDKAISEQELADKIQAYADTELGLLGVQGTVTFGGQTMPGAQVTFDPEPFLADVIKPATGTVGQDGYYIMKTEGQDIEAVQPGIYFVRISKANGGNERVPARYNEQTELGVEVGGPEDPQSRGTGQFDFSL